MITDPFPIIIPPDDSLIKVIFYFILEIYFNLISKNLQFK